LDKFIEFLKNFSFLKQLDLFGNPLAEEPDYRLKIIHAMPQLYVLDRHRITVPERQKAADLHEQGGPKFKKPVTKAAKEAMATDNKMKGFSKGEKDLYAEVS